jgi:HlyD family secretion protein
MFQSIRKIYYLLAPDQRRSLVRLQLLIIFMSFTEVLGVLSIGPFMSLVSDIEIINEDPLIAAIYNFSGISSDQGFIIFSGVIVITLLSLAALINIFTIWKISMYGAKVGARLSNRLFVYYMQQPWLFHAGGNSSELVNKIVQESTRLNTLVINPFMQFNARFVMGMTMLIAMFIYDPFVSTIAISLFSSTYYALYFFARGRLIRNGNITTQQQARRFRLMSEGFGGIKDTLILGRHRNFIRRFISASDQMAHASGTTNTLTLFPKYLLELLSFGGVISLVIFLILTNNGQIEAVIPSLAIFALAGFKILPAIQSCYSSVSVLRGNLSSFEALEEDLQNSYKSLDNNIWSEDSRADGVILKDAIIARDVFFHYPANSKVILDNINLEIKAGQFIGLVGSSGSGKSTLIDILLGLIDPVSGEISIDGEILNSKNLRKWQNGIGVVSQNIFLADASIRENIAFGLSEEEIDEKQVKLGVELANLSALIKTLPEGLNTRVGERGIQLSGGQRQRIGIARALYNNANTLIFDEATSALDGISEKKVMDSIYSLAGSKTIIAIAHRLSTVKRCDAIFLLEEGKIIDSGSYESLLSRNNLFKTMTDLA